MALIDWFRRRYRSVPVVRELNRLEEAAARYARVFVGHAGVLRSLQELEVAGLMASERFRDPLRLLSAHHQVFSQGGEDGILAEIFRRVGVTGRTFAEIGIGDGLENNTAYLLACGWAGLWVDGSAAGVDAARRRHAADVAAGRLTVTRAFVTMENAGELVAGGTREPDLLSLDIDQNTFWAWKGMPDDYRPRVVAVEYNAAFPADVDWAVRYEPDRTWDGTCYFGASLKAFERLGRDKGYALVGCEMTGTNAFFVRDDLAGERFRRPFTAENHYEPPRYHLLRRTGHPRGCGPAVYGERVAGGAGGVRDVIQ